MRNVLVWIATAAIVGLAGCGFMDRSGGPPPPPMGYRARAEEAAAVASLKAHGRTSNVNGAAFDAMFFRNHGTHPFVDTDEDALSTFAVDVDTGSYTLCRAYLERGYLPPQDAVRVEEFVNYFPYDDAPPAKTSSDAFAVHLEAAPSRFGSEKMLLRVGIKAREVAAADRKPAVLTFVIDVSGSMATENRLELVKKALRMLVDQMREGDAIGIAVYGSQGREVLTHRDAGDRAAIFEAIDSLHPEGATNAEEGLAIGYRMAAKAMRPGAINAVILCSDGVANVGRTGPEDILQSIREQAEAGTTLSTIGFGMGNYNDVLMEQLADRGNGNYAYVDTLDEARRVFVDRLTGTLQVVARDAKVQVAFDPAVVRSYRLLGYENRDVADTDFRNDRGDGGEIGAGHSVTALYEIKRWPEKTGRLATVTVRYHEADGPEVREVARTIATDEATADFAKASPALRLAACAAEYAEILRGSYWARGGRLDDVRQAVEAIPGPLGRTEEAKELASLIRQAQKLGADERCTATGEAAGSSMEE